MKKVWKAAVLVSCGLLLTGCTLLTGSGRKERMLEYMNTRYDDRFEYIGSYSVSEILVASEKYPDKKIWVMEYGGNSSGYTDNYLDYVYEEASFEAIRGMLEEAFGVPVVLTCRIPERGMPCSLPADVSLDGYLEGREDPFIFFAVVSPDYTPEESDTERRIMEMFGRMNITAVIHFAETPEVFEGILSGELQQVTDGKQLDIMIMDGQITDCHWS